MEDKRLIIQLRDCFTAGYTFPQFCIDKGIKKPLFVAPNSEYEEILWEIYVQFHYHRFMSASFSYVDDETTSVNLYFAVGAIGAMRISKWSELDKSKFDKIIVLTADRNFLSDAKKPSPIYLDEVIKYFNKRVYYEIPIYNFLQRHSGVKLVLVNRPTLLRNSHNTEYEKNVLDEVINNKFWVGTLRKKIELAKKQNTTIATPYDFLGYDNEKTYKLLEGAERKLNLDGSVSLVDNEFLGIKNGHRITADQPKNYKNTIYFVGSCVYYGYGVPYDKTVESYLQRMLNENNLPYRVENESRFLARRRLDLFYNLNSLAVKSGDIIFLIGSNVSDKIPFWDVNKYLQQPHNYGKIFPDRCHINEIGHKALAEIYFNLLKKNNFLRDFDFKYPIPPPPGSQIRNTSGKFFFCSKFSAE